MKDTDYLIGLSLIVLGGLLFWPPASEFFAPIIASGIVGTGIAWLMYGYDKVAEKEKKK